MEEKWEYAEKRLQSWMKNNRALLAVSAMVGFLLTPFLWPFFLAVIYTALSLAVPVFFILLGIKMPWGREKSQPGETAEKGNADRTGQEAKKTSTEGKKERVYEQRKDPVSKGNDSKDGAAPEPEGKEKTAQGRKDGNAAGHTGGSALSWYTQEGKDRILSLMKKAQERGACGLSVRKDGCCSAKMPDGYCRIGALRNFPGEQMELLAGMLRQDVRVPVIKVKGKYLCVFWKREKAGKHTAKEGAV